MKIKIKKIFKNIFLIIAIALVFICAGLNVLFATEEEHYSEDEENPFQWMRDIAHYGYVNLSAMTYRDIFNIRSSDPNSTTDPPGVWNDCASVCCLHDENKNDKYTDQNPFLIIDINPNGDDPTALYMTMYNKDEDDEENQITYYDLSDDEEYGTYYAMLGYIAAQAEMLDHDSEVAGEKSETKYSNAFRTAWMKVKDHLQEVTDDAVTFPGIQDGYWSETYEGYLDAKKYAENLSSTTSTTYSARIIVFQGGGSETRAILTGIENTVLVPTITKYISSVQVPSEYEYGTSYDGTEISNLLNYQETVDVVYSDGSTRESMTEVEKANSPLSLSPYTYITYTITASVNKSGTYTVYDQFDSYLCNYISDGSSNWTLSINELTNTENTLSITQYFSANTIYTFTVKLYVISRDNTSTPIENRSSLETASSSDYFSLSGSPSDSEVTFDGNFKKYIVAVNGESVEDRSLYTSDEAEANPVTVQSGDIVTYRIEVDNTSASSYVDTIIVTIQDTMEDGLEAYGNSDIPDGTTSFTYTFSNIPAGSNDTYDFDVLVTKSDMYLVPIENEAIFVSGSYYQRQNDTWTYNVEDIEGLQDVEFNYVSLQETTIDSSSMTDVGSSDYVQLDDVEIAGYVWDDENADGVKDSSESGIDGITVYIHSSRSDFLLDAESYGVSYDSSAGLYYVITDSNGYYSFGRVKKGNSDYTEGTRKYLDTSGYVDYYLTFDYAGVYYNSTIYTDLTDVTNSGPTNNWENKSHASEDLTSNTNREEFNGEFETISYNKSWSGSTTSSSSQSLYYDKDGHTSELLSSSETIITAKSVNLFKYSANTKTYNNIIKDSSYLKYINLGLVKRDQADLDLTKDVVKANLEINGFTTEYTYESLGEGTYLGDYKLSTPYKLLIYEEDYNYRTSNYTDVISNIKGDDNDLTITLTYKITITNASTEEYYTVVREIIDIYSNEMSLNRIYDLDGNEYNRSFRSTYNATSNYNYDGYETVFITGSNLEKTLAPGETMDIYLEYSVNKVNDAIVIDSESDLGKVNVAQIGAFSVYTESGDVAGVVDKDSNPGNLVNSEYDITDESNFEDDTFYTTIQVLLRDESSETTTDIDVLTIPYSYRQISGNVWEDLETDETTLDQEIGNGIRDSGEDGAQNIYVKLLEVVSDGDDEYLVDTGIWTTTDENGNYDLESSSRLHAGTYVVRFIYGDDADVLKENNDGESGNTIKYSGQDYKSTAYTDIGDSSDESEIVEATAFSEVNIDNEVSTAKDNELRRLEVISYSTTMTYTLDNILKSTYSSSGEETGDLEELAENTGMYADTKKFNVQIEYYDYYYDPDNFIYDGLLVNNYKIKEVNFGLIERPITKLELMNDMTEMIAITSTSDNEELVHLYFDIIYTKDGDTITHESVLNEEKSTGYSNVQVLNRSSSNQGFRYVNIDTDLLQGMTVIVKYKVAIANISDIDTSNQNLIDMIYNYDLENVVEFLEENILNGNANGGIYLYSDSDDSGISENMLSSYTFSGLAQAIEELENSEFSDYINQNSNDYYSGYFLGNTYYAVDYTDTSTIDTTTDALVETRVDQIIDYVDNDLVFKMEDNTNEDGVGKFLNYTIEEIANYGLLAGITEESNITDGKESYITESKNNLAFSIENNEINPELYKFLTPITDETADTLTDDDLYTIEISISRTLSSEEDSEGLQIDNLSEIIKVTNTAGRKVYVGAENSTGYIGNTTLSVGDINDENKEVTIVAVAGETDTDYAEYTTFSPPTGYTQSELQEQKTINIIIIVISSLAIISVILIIVMINKNKKKIYR